VANSDVNHLVGDNNRVWQEEKSMLTKSPNTPQTVRISPTGMNEKGLYVYLEL